MTVLHLDFETRSAVDLKKTGVYVYAADATTDIWCMAYAFDDEPVELWVPDDEIPLRIVEHILGGNTLVAHNASFERTIWRYILGPRYGFPVPETSQWRCTMSYCYALGLPGSLDGAAYAVGLQTRKDMTGHRLMMQMAKPRQVKDGKITWWDDEERLLRLYDYCKQDVEVERQLEKKIRPLPPFEQELWHLDQKINDRGVLVDEDLALAAKKIVQRAQDDLNDRMRQLTGYAVKSTSAVNQIITWVRQQGVEVDSLNAGAIDTLLEEDIPANVREVLMVRREAAKASVSKIDALLRGKSPEDDRAKGLLQYHAASTGRWGGRRFQPQNLRRPEEDDIDTLIEVVSTGDYDLCAMMYDRPLSAVADTLRGMLKAAPGHRIVAADYSNIEGRVLAWLAGEKWKIKAFEEFDQGIGPDLYIKSYAETFGVPLFDEKDPRRQVGKTMELAGGYQGGHGAYLNFLTDKTLAQLVALVKDAVTPDEWDEFAQRYKGSHGLALDEWTSLAIVIHRWREKHSAIKQFWYDMEEAAVFAVQNRGQMVKCRSIVFKVVGSFLFMRLPSGRLLSYPFPEVREFDTPWGDTKQGLTYFSTIDQSKKAKVVSDERNTSNWARIKTYGGMLVENATQAVARDILAVAMPKLEAAGYPIILTVHDEIVCEVPEGFGSVEEMERIMCDLPAWAEGLPVAAKGFEGKRYRK